MTNDQKREPTPVDTIAEEWVDTQLELYPEFHVWLGRPGREGEYADYSPAGAEHAIAKVKEALARIEAAEPVDEIDRITKMDLARELQLTVEKHEAGFAQRDLNVIASPAQELRDIFDLVPTDTEEDWANVAMRAGTKVEIDPKTGQIKSPSSANQFLGRKYREGWTLG